MVIDVDALEPQVQRLKEAIEGECDGLAIDDKQATTILQYVADGLRDGRSIPKEVQTFPDDDAGRKAFVLGYNAALKDAGASQLALPAVPVPGWRLVPEVPTLEMLRAMNDGFEDDDDGQDYDECYAQAWSGALSAALKVAPRPLAASLALADEQKKKETRHE